MEGEGDREFCPSLYRRNRIVFVAEGEEGIFGGGGMERFQEKGRIRWLRRN